MSTTIEQARSIETNAPPPRVAITNSGDRFMRRNEVWFPLFDTFGVRSPTYLKTSGRATCATAPHRDLTPST